MNRADADLERMRADAESDWAGRLLDNIAPAPLVGEEWLTKVPESWLTRGTNTPPLSSDTLSDAERRVLDAASHGLTERMIADLFVVSPLTVQTQLKAARYRLRAKNTLHACCIALRRGIIE